MKVSAVFNDRQQWENIFVIPPSPSSCRWKSWKTFNLVESEVLNQRRNLHQCTLRYITIDCDDWTLSAKYVITNSLPVSHSAPLIEALPVAGENVEVLWTSRYRDYVENSEMINISERKYDVITSQILPYTWKKCLVLGALKSAHKFTQKLRIKDSTSAMIESFIQVFTPTL